MTPRTEPSPTFVARPLASFQPSTSDSEPLFRDWLAGHSDVLFRWTLAHMADDESRRGFVEVAVATQRLRGATVFLTWLYSASLRAARRQALSGGLPEADLSGLAPELRAVLRLVAHGGLQTDEAQTLLTQPLAEVRGRLVQARLRS